MLLWAWRCLKNVTTWWYVAQMWRGGAIQGCRQSSEGGSRVESPAAVYHALLRLPVVACWLWARTSAVAVDATHCVHQPSVETQHVLDVCSNCQLEEGGAKLAHTCTCGCWASHYDRSHLCCPLSRSRTTRFTALPSPLSTVSHSSLNTCTYHTARTRCALYCPPLSTRSSTSCYVRHVHNEAAAWCWQPGQRRVAAKLEAPTFRTAQQHRIDRSTAHCSKLHCQLSLLLRCRRWWRFSHRSCGAHTAAHNALLTRLCSVTVVSASLTQATPTSSCACVLHVASQPPLVLPSLRPLPCSSRHHLALNASIFYRRVPPRLR